MNDDANAVAVATAAELTQPESTDVATRRFVIAAVIDKSGSMTSLANETIGGFNQFLDKQKALDVDRIARMHVTLFDTDVHHMSRFAPLDMVLPLSQDNYRPDGMTALYDAVGATVDALKKDVRPEDQVLVLVITDGQENSSRMYKVEDIQKLVDAAQAKGWEFVFLGSSLTDWRGQGAATHAGTVAQFSATSAGTRAAWGTASTNTASMYKSYAAGSSMSAQSMDWNSSDGDDEPLTPPDNQPS